MVWAGSRLGTLSCQRQLPEIRFRTRKPYWQTNGVAGWRNHCVIEAIAIHPFHVTSSPLKKNDSIVLSIVFCPNRCSTLIWSETLPILYHIISYYNNIYIIEYIYIYIIIIPFANQRPAKTPPPPFWGNARRCRARGSGAGAAASRTPRSFWGPRRSSAQARFDGSEKWWVHGIQRKFKGDFMLEKTV